MGFIFQNRGLSQSENVDLWVIFLNNSDTTQNKEGKSE